MSKLVETNKKIEEAVVGGYKKIEEGVVGSFTKMSDKFVDSFLAKDGESVKEAKARMEAERKALEEKNKAYKAEVPTVNHNEYVEKSMQQAKEAGAKARKMAGLE